MGCNDPRDLAHRALGHAGDAVYVAADRVLSYAALGRAVRELARRLSARGSLVGRISAVAVRDTTEFLVTTLAVWSLGGAVLPCDRRAPPAALDRMFARARPWATITEAAIDGTLELTELPAPRQVAPSTALLLFTSGSSAEPKGVLLSSAGIVHNVDAILRYLPVAEAGRIGLFSPLAYSYGLVGQALTALFAGATLIPMASPYPVEHLERIAALDVRGISSVPVTLRALARVAVEANIHPPLRFLASAGAALDVASADLLRSGFPGAELFNQYGLTEASPRVSAISDRHPAFAWGSVGAPLAGIEVRIASGDGTPSASNGEGEVEVRGPSVMLGYLDDPEATARVLSADGWLRSGDAGRIDDEGLLYVSGRLDGLVKCAGERVSVEEVAALLRSAPGVKDACVIATPHPELGATLFAFVEGPREVAEELRSWAREHLPPAQRPTKVTAVDALPRLSNGKVAVGELRKRVTS